MSPQEAMFQLTEAMMLVMIMSMPPIIVASLVGIVVSLLQTLTQVQEQTLSFGITLIAVAVTITIMAGMIGSEMLNFTTKLFDEFPRIVRRAPSVGPGTALPQIEVQRGLAFGIQLAGQGEDGARLHVAAHPHLSRNPPAAAHLGRVQPVEAADRFQQVLEPLQPQFDHRARQQHSGPLRPSAISPSIRTSASPRRRCWTRTSTASRA